MKIVPGISIGLLVLGMAREEYETLLGISDDVFKRTPEALDQVVAFKRKRVHLTVDHDWRIKTITVFRPEEVELENVQLLNRDLSAVEEDLQQTAFAFERVDVGLWSPRAGVLIIETDGVVDGVEILKCDHTA